MFQKPLSHRGFLLYSVLISFLSPLYIPKNWGYMRGYKNSLKDIKRKCTPMTLTNTACNNAKPAEKPYKKADSHGLYLYVQPNGARYWRLKYRFMGKEKTLA